MYVYSDTENNDIIQTFYNLTKSDIVEVVEV